MSNRPRKSTRLTVSLEEQDYDALADLAVARDVSLSWLIRQAVKQLIDRAQSVNSEGTGSSHDRTSEKD